MLFRSEDIKKYIHYSSSYPLQDQLIIITSDELNETDDAKIFQQECGLIDSALINIEPNKVLEN